MKKLLIIALFAAVALCGAAATASAQVSDIPSTVTINVTIGSHARLTLNATHGAALVVNFGDADPETSPTITAPAIAVSARGRTSTAGHITLTVTASQDLTAPGPITIPASNISWAADTDLSAGALIATTAVTLGDWVGSGIRVGNHTYVLANDWAYATGNYTTTVTYTLTAA